MDVVAKFAEVQELRAALHEYVLKRVLDVQLVSASGTWNLATRPGDGVAFLLRIKIADAES